MTPVAGPSWSGPRARPAALRPVVVGVLTLGLVVVCLLPLADHGVHALVVVVGLVLTLGVAAWPPLLPRPRWSIDATGVTTWDPDGTTTHLPATAYDAVAIGQGPATDAEGRALPGGRTDRLLLVHTSSAAVVQAVPLDRVGTAFAVYVVARRLGVAVLLPEAGRAAVVRDRSRLHDALAAPAPTVTADRASLLVDPSGGRPRTVVLRLLTGAVGVLLVATLAEAVGGTVTGRIGAACGVLLAVAALPRLARGRDVRTTLRWRLDAGAIEVTDTEHGGHRFAAGEVGAVVLTAAEHSGHGARPLQAALVVDHDGAPVVEIPLRGLDPAELARALGRHGVRVVRSGVQPWEVRDGFSPPGRTP